ncbi:MAG: peroxiredoxin family protein [Myxococcales bacterium]
MRLPALLVSGLLAASCATTSGASGPATATDFTLNSIEGGAVSLSDYLGKKVIVMDFMATWCAPCTMQLPHLQRFYETYKDDGLVVLGISMDGPETVANVGPYARRQGVGFPVLLDEDTRVTSLYNPRRAAPLVVFIGRDGSVHEVREGFIQGDEKIIEQTIQRLLGKAEPASAAQHEPQAAN